MILWKLFVNALKRTKPLNLKHSFIGCQTLSQLTFVSTQLCKLFCLFLVGCSQIKSFRFKHKNPEDANEVPDGFLSDCNPDSLKILKSYADKSLLSGKILDRFQFERMGFFTIDPDSTNEKVSYNLRPIIIN